ncbi:MAG: O-antigen ligase family protein [Defluviitaleaceae bacterium]|nr:O-antigen ligase family protein [Defluviitaleaceae bacterium]
MKTRKIRWAEILLFVVAAVVPIIVRRAAVDVAPELLMFHQAAQVDDFFSVNKAWLLMLCAGLLAFQALTELAIGGSDFYSIKASAKNLLRNPVIVLVAVYVFFVLISNLFSPYTQTALWGAPDRREGLFVQLAYITIFLAAMYHAKDEFSVRVFLVGLMASSLIMGAVGFSQFINMDFFATEFAGLLVMGTPTRMNILFNMAYGTNFNPNTFGLVTAMLFPVMFAAAIAVDNKILRGLFVLAGVLMAIGVIASRSVGGLIGSVAAIMAIVVTLLVHWLLNREKRENQEKQEKQEKEPQTGKIGKNRTILIIVAVGVLITSGFGFMFRAQIYDDLIFTLGRIAAIFEPPNLQMPEFTFADNHVTISDRGATYNVMFPIIPGPPEITLPDNTVVVPLIVETVPGAEPVFMYTYDIPGFGTAIIQRQFNLYLYRNIHFMLENGVLHMIHLNGELIDPNEPIPYFGFEGWETWGSNRGYIFSRTIPLIPQSLLIGQGSDTFVLLFPNHDMINKLRFFENPHMTVDKAHNLYLQTAVTTGVVSALALMGIFGFYIVTTFLSLIRHNIKRERDSFWLRLGLLASVSAFSVSSLSTDSTVSSTPIFWIIIGLGFALNRFWGRTYAEKTN